MANQDKSAQPPLAQLVAKRQQRTSAPFTNFEVSQEHSKGPGREESAAVVGVFLREGLSPDHSMAQREPWPTPRGSAKALQTGCPAKEAYQNALEKSERREGPKKGPPSQRGLGLSWMLKIVGKNCTSSSFPSRTF